MHVTYKLDISDCYNLSFFNCLTEFSIYNCDTNTEINRNLSIMYNPHSISVISLHIIILIFIPENPEEISFHTVITFLLIYEYQFLLSHESS